MRVVLSVVALLLLAGCASKPPSQINNACAIFDQRGGFINNWYRAAKSAERSYGVPAPIMMATIYTESSFRAKARSPRQRGFLGIFPGKRASTAYGYAQALDGTWERYQRETGKHGARRTDFADAIDFVGWYHATSSRVNGIARNDAYNLYLAYYSGHAGYARGSWRGNAGVQKAANRAASMANTYAAQMQQCGRS